MSDAIRWALAADIKPTKQVGADRQRVVLVALLPYAYSSGYTRSGCGSRGWCAGWSGSISASRRPPDDPADRAGRTGRAAVSQTEVNVGFTETSPGPSTPDWLPGAQAQVAAQLASPLGSRPLVVSVPTGDLSDPAVVDELRAAAERLMVDAGPGGT
jgi:hypothetical protein